MTYPDPKRVRDNRLTIRLDDYEHKLVQAMANYQGEQLSTLVRDMAVREAEQLLAVAQAQSLPRHTA